MTRILVVYGTTDGHTAKVAAAIADTLRAGGALVDVHQVGRTHCLPDAYDGVIVASPVRAGKYLKSVRRWVRAHAAVHQWQDHSLRLGLPRDLAARRRRGS